MGKPSHEAFGKSEILRAEPDIGKKAIIKMSDAATKPVACQPLHPYGAKFCPSRWHRAQLSGSLPSHFARLIIAESAEDVLKSVRLVGDDLPFEGRPVPFKRTKLPAMCGEANDPRSLNSD